MVPPHSTITVSMERTSYREVNTYSAITVTDDQQDATFSVYLFIYSQSALHVSSDVFAHHQEHLTVFTASYIVHLYCCRLV